MALFDLDHWREIGGALAANKLRTAATAFGVFWGIFMLMALLGSGNGLENGVTRGFDGLATNSFFVWSRTTSRPYRGLPAGRRVDLNNDDYLALLKRVPEAAVVAPRIQMGGFRGGNNASRRQKTGSFEITGDYPEIALIQPAPLVAGRFLNRIDIEQKRKVAVIGTRVREILFDHGEDPIGDHIRVRGVYFKVVGIHRPNESGEAGNQQANRIYLPFSTAQQAFNWGDSIGWFAIASNPAVPASETEDKVLGLLRERHRIHPEDDRALGHFNLEERFKQVQGLFLGIRVLVWIVGIGTLAAGVIGVSNIMLVIVRQRTKEIGIRKALGATPANIVGQVVLEAVLLTSVAGYAGLILGMLGMDALAGVLPDSGDNVMFLNPGVELGSALQALAVLVVSGALAGLMPAQRAARVRPVEALHG